jgi:short chain dehydrogenase
MFSAAKWCPLASPAIVALGNSWIIINTGGGPTDDKPTVTLTAPDPDTISSFLNIRVANIQEVYEDWSSKRAQLLIPNKWREMSEQRAKSALITGASTGLGKDLARQLAQREDFDWIYLGCRTPAKAERAMNELQQVTGRSIFEVVLIDLSDMASVRAAVPAITRPFNAVVMNAAGTGGPTPGALVQDGGCPSEWARPWSCERASQSSARGGAPRGSSGRDRETCSRGALSPRMTRAGRTPGRGHLACPSL